MNARSKTGCQACRSKHLKCDASTPRCRRCRVSGRKCVRTLDYKSYQARQGFSDNQRWMTIPNDLTFVDETRDLASIYSDDLDDDPSATHSDSATVHRPSSICGTPEETLDWKSQPSQLSQHDIRDHTLHLQSHTSVESAGDIDGSPPVQSREWDALWNSPRSAPYITPQSAALAESSVAALNDVVNPPYLIDDADPIDDQDGELAWTTPIHLEHPVWPLTDSSEALLLRHFVQNIAIWLDLCDTKQHFQVDVPRRAGTCPILLNAIFALSARHLDRTGTYDPLASNRYHQKCLKHLIPMLNDAATVSDETLFAATIILRVLEEIDVPDMNVHGHMLGIQVFVNARDPSVTGDGLSEAAFWVGLRQEIYSAIIHQKPVRLNLDHCLVDRSLDPTDDVGWANRAVLHCADVLTLCFADSTIAFSQWKLLKDYNEKWQASKPPSFTPIYYRDANRRKREVFPEIWYQHSCHVIGVQHHIIAQILLSIFNPKIPRIGGVRRAAVNALENEVRGNLRALCGIGLSNRWMPPGMFTASMGIAISGDRFSDRLDQEAILDVLVQTERDHARPTASVQQQMRQCWGWEPDD